MAKANSLYGGLRRREKKVCCQALANRRQKEHVGESRTASGSQAWSSGCDYRDHLCEPSHQKRVAHLLSQIPDQLNDQLSPVLLDKLREYYDELRGRQDENHQMQSRRSPQGQDGVKASQLILSYLPVRQPRLSQLLHGDQPASKGFGCARRTKPMASVKLVGGNDMHKSERPGSPRWIQHVDPDIDGLFSDPGTKHSPSVTTVNAPRPSSSSGPLVSID